MSCKCQECGINYNVDLIIEDSLWEIIKPKYKDIGAGMLCGACIMVKIEEIAQVGAIQAVSDILLKEHSNGRNEIGMSHENI